MNSDQSKPVSQSACKVFDEYIVPKHILARADISDGAKFLFGVICRVGVTDLDDLANRIGSTHARTKRYLRELSERPLIVLEPEGGDA
jgi:hypothetical protein